MKALYNICNNSYPLKRVDAPQYSRVHYSQGAAVNCNRLMSESIAEQKQRENDCVKRCSRENLCPKNYPGDVEDEPLIVDGIHPCSDVIFIDTFYVVIYDSVVSSATTFGVIIGGIRKKSGRFIRINSSFCHFVQGVLLPGRRVCRKVGTYGMCSPLRQVLVCIF